MFSPFVVQVSVALLAVFSVVGLAVAALYPRLVGNTRSEKRLAAIRADKRELAAQRITNEEGRRRRSVEDTLRELEETQKAKARKSQKPTLMIRMRQAGESVQNLDGRFVGPEHIHPMPMESRGHPWTRGGGGVVVIGHLDRQGRVDLALQTVAILASCGHSLPLTIIGDGPRRNALVQLAQRLGVTALVRFLGAMPADQARGHLARADLLLHTTRGDDTAGPALEALVTGVPVVACWDGGAIVDVVPESGAGRLSIPSAEALADNVLNLLADVDRLALTRLVGEAWRARLAPDNVAQLCEDWYRHALAS